MRLFRRKKKEEPLPLITIQFDYSSKCFPGIVYKFNETERGHLCGALLCLQGWTASGRWEVTNIKIYVNGKKFNDIKEVI